MRTFAAVFAGGAIGLLILKLVLSLLGPLLGIMLGLLALAFKVILFAAVAYFIYALIRGKKRDEAEVA